MRNLAGAKLGCSLVQAKLWLNVVFTVVYGWRQTKQDETSTRVRLAAILLWLMGRGQVTEVVSHISFSWVAGYLEIILFPLNIFRVNVKEEEGHMTPFFSNIF